jgi:hypothetical protein
VSNDDDDEDDDAAAADAPLFSCRHMGRETELHSHAFAEDVIYHIGWAAFVSRGSYSQLMPDAAQHWNSLSKTATKKVLTKLPKLKIPGGKMKT